MANCLQIYGIVHTCPVLTLAEELQEPGPRLGKTVETITIVLTLLYHLRLITKSASTLTLNF